MASRKRGVVRRRASPRRSRGASLRRTVTIIKSRWPQDYEDREHAPPWSYSGEAFKDWVWEVLLDMGKAGRRPRTVAEAADIAESAGYELSIA